MASKDVLLNVLEKFTSPYINLTPFEKADPDGRKLPPLTYGKSWASEQKYIKDGKEVIDPRFQIKLKDYWDHTELTHQVKAR